MEIWGSLFPTLTVYNAEPVNFQLVPCSLPNPVCSVFTAHYSPDRDNYSVLSDGRGIPVKKKQLAWIRHLKAQVSKTLTYESQFGAKSSFFIAGSDWLHIMDIWGSLFPTLTVYNAEPVNFQLVPCSLPNPVCVHCSVFTRQRHLPSAQWCEGDSAKKSNICCAGTSKFY